MHIVFQRALSVRLPNAPDTVTVRILYSCDLDDVSDICILQSKMEGVHLTVP